MAVKLVWLFVTIMKTESVQVCRLDLATSSFIIYFCPTIKEVYRKEVQIEPFPDMSETTINSTLIQIDFRTENSS